MAEMAMIESASGDIVWECSACKGIVRDKKNFERKTKTCPKCNAEVTQFHNLFTENGDYVHLCDGSQHE